MGRAHAGMVVLGLTAAVLLAAAPGLWAQEPLVAKLDPSGMVRVFAGDAELAMIELNAHGPEWQHAPQASATARFSVLPNGGSRRFVGTLPVPKTDGGAIMYTETLKLLPTGLKLEYEVGMTKAMKLDGLQVSVLLPVAQYAAKELVISNPDADPQIATFPKEQIGNAFQVWSGEGSRIEVAKGTDQAVTLELRAAADVVIQDLRQWKQDSFEIRFPAIMEAPGRDVTADDRLHFDVTVSFAGPVKLEGP